LFDLWGHAEIPGVASFFETNIFEILSRGKHEGHNVGYSVVYTGGTEMGLKKHK
jgi:hypothetical protein